MKVIAVTGSTGGIGREVVKSLKATGYKVYELSRKNVNNSMNWLYFDLNDIEALILPERLDFFVHIAHDFSPITWEDMEKKNVRTTLQLYEKMKNADCKEFIFISSMAAFDGVKSNYGKAKRIIELMLLNKGVICIRPGLVYGVSSGLAANLEEQVVNSKIIPLIDGGKQKIYPVAIQNLVRGILTVIDNPNNYKFRPVVIASQKSVTLRNFALALARHSGKNPLFFTVPGILVFLCLRFLELLRIKLPFRSDSVVSLRNQCSEPFEGNHFLDVESDETFSMIYKNMLS